MHVISTFPPAYAFGGPPKVTFDLCKGLSKKGHEVEVYTTNAYDQNSNFSLDNRILNVDGIKVTYFPNWLRIDNLFIAPEMVTKLKKTGCSFDILHVHFGRQLYDAYSMFLRKRHKVPLVVQAHGSLPYIGKRRLLKMLYDFLIGQRIFSNASKLIALNQFEAEQYRRMGVPEEKIAIIPNGIDLSEYANLPPKGSFKSKHNIPGDKKIILYLGRIHRIKGIDFLIKAYAYLVKKIGCKDAILVIAGPDDGYLNEAKALAKSLSIGDSVMFTGPLYGRDKLEAYVDAEVYVLPSRYETFPMTVLEAYACGKPVIASNVGGLRELVVDGETGLLFKAGSIQQLSKKLYQVLHDDYETSEMGYRGRSFLEKNFMIEKIVFRLEKVYGEVYLRHSIATITGKHEF
ncbi:MAG: glycosyltransferase [Thermoproteota archaeon]